MRAGALGDLLLLRRAVASLHASGHVVHLLAPDGPAGALRGPGPSEVPHLLPWEGSASLFRGPDPRGAHALPYEAAVAFTRGTDLVRNLRAAIPTVVARDPIPPRDLAAARWYAGALRVLGVADAGPPAPIAPSAAEQAAAAAVVCDLPPRFVAVHPGSGSAAKNWPAARFADLLDALGETRFLLVRGPADDEACRALAARHPGAVLADSLPVRVLGATLAAAGVYVGNDSGVTHLAATFGTPTVALFGPTDARVWAPDGARVMAAPGGDMARLKMDEVADAVRAVRRAANSF